MVWYSHLLKNFPQFIVVHTVKGFGIGKKAGVDVFLELSCFLDDPVDLGDLISSSSAFSKSSLNIWRSTVHVLLKPGLENFEHYFASMWDECKWKSGEWEIKLPTSVGWSKNQESSRETSNSALLPMPKPLTVWITTNCGSFLKRWDYQTTLHTVCQICMQVKKQQLELDMEKQPHSKSG